MWPNHRKSVACAISCFGFLLSLINAPGSSEAQIAVGSYAPLALHPSEKTRIEIVGSGFDESLRYLSSSDIRVETVSLEPGKLVLDLQPIGLPNGPFAAIWAGSNSGVTPPLIFAVDPLASKSAPPSNTSAATAESHSLPCAIDGALAPKTSNYYAIDLEEGAPIGIDLLAQRLGSSIDGVIRISDSLGTIIHEFDDTELGPDPSFDWIAPKKDRFVIEILDSRHQAAGHYRLRLTERPIVRSVYPAVQSGTEPQSVSFLSSDAVTASDQSTWTTHVDSISGTSYAAFVPGVLNALNQAQRILPFRIVSEQLDASQNTENAASVSLTPPVGLAGLLSLPNEVDHYQLTAQTGVPYRIRSSTRSSGSRSLVKLRVLKLDGSLIAESPFQLGKEPVLDFANPSDEPIQIQISDWMGRSGHEFSYFIEITPRQDYVATFKPDPALKDLHLYEQNHGAIAVLVAVERLGYAGKLEVRPSEGLEHWQVLNPTIPENVAEHRLFLRRKEGVPGNSSDFLRLTTSKVDSTNSADGTIAVSADTFLRIKNPANLYFKNWQSTGLIASEIPSKGESSVVQATTVQKLPEDQDRHEFTIPKAQFEPAIAAGAIIASTESLVGWTATASVEGETIKIVLQKNADGGAEPFSEVALNLYYEHENLERIQKAKLPVQWIAIPESVESYPAQVVFHRQRDEQRLVLLGLDSQGYPKNRTEDVIWTTSDANIAEVRGSVIHPKTNGNCEVTGQIGRHIVKIPVSVAMNPDSNGIEFENEVLVALSKQGCNSGACHGSPSGKGGFRLSLRAFDKIFDELTLKNEFAQRRINTIEPEESLLLQKGIMRTPHGGGLQMRTSDVAYGVLREWIASGANLDRPETTRCVKLSVSPSASRTYLLKNGKLPLVATAHFADGKTRDVSKMVAYESSNIKVATVSSDGVVEPLIQGETVILVRFLEHIESIPMVFVDPKESFNWIAQPVQNEIDTLVDEKLTMMEINASPLCSDETFVRRVYLDVLGHLPSTEQVSEFIQSNEAEKRSKLIDQLLEQPGYASFWALKWSDLLRVTAKGLTEEGVYKYHRWIEKAVRENMPYDQFARELLASSGGTFTHPATNFYRTATDMNESVETVSQVFLGARLQCARCHNHPFERWTQDNYYGLGAFFNRVERTPSARPNEVFVRATQAGDVIQPRTQQVMAPWAPGLTNSEPNSNDRRQQFAEWLIEPSNPYFARVEANRIWSHLFARGIVDPIDDFRDSNPPTNKPLLDALADRFAKSGYDRKGLIRFILNSRTYQTASETEPTSEGDNLYFSHQEPRLLTAEQLFDAIIHLTGTTHDFNPLPAGTKAVDIPSPDTVKVDFLRIFGQPERSTVCACERADDSNLGMAIELFNGSLVHDKLKDPQNRFRKAVAEGVELPAILEQIYLAAYARKPDAEEFEMASKYCSGKEDVASALEDLCWAIINSDEFLFQH